ncbi:hypothetical protein [Streptomyces sp. NPDC004296]|uniref:hypothetical protein n=1 Tax=Streptomyces sp. NPDC004296 TaxID=3364697 RepID=UPI0036CCC003
MAAVPLDLLDRIRALERQVRELTGRAQTRPALNRITHGAVVIGEGGTLDVQAPGGAQILGVGSFPATGRYGVSMAREDGTGVALEVGGNDTSASQMVRLFARGGYPSPIVMDDGYADGYLGRPWVPIPCTPYMTISSDDEAALYSGQMLTQHKVLRVNLQLSGPAGTGAEALLRIGGQQYGPTWSLAASATTKDVNDRVPLPAADFPHGRDVSAVVWARRTSGTGTCTLRLRGIWGTNTVSATEATS